jgi:TolB-like protein
MTGLKISLLGGMEIGPAGGAGEIAVTRKTGAMLAYLALQEGQAQTRDKLAGLFWSRNTDEQARTNLRQALSRLRKAVANGGEGPLLADADRVALDMERVDLDVTQFKSLLGEGGADSTEQAIALYRGDLLDGVHLNESSFDHWIRGERERLRFLAIDALLKLVEDYCATGDPERCISAALRLMSIDPLQEPAHRALMRAYAAQGRHAMALQQYQSCRELLQEELQVEPEAATVALFHEIRHRRNGSESDVAFVAKGPNGDLVDLSRTGGRPSIAVLPFVNMGGDPDADYFASGITGNILASLTRFRDLFVIAGVSSGSLSGPDLDPVQASRKLGVAHVLEGSVMRTGGRLRVTVQLVDARTGQRLWGEKYDREADDLLSVQDDITANIVASLAGHVEDASRIRSETKPPESMMAYDYLLRARHRAGGGGREDVMEGRRLFEQALELDPSLAAAWAGLAVSYITEYEAEWSPLGRLRALDRAQTFAERAVALDDGCTFGHWTLAITHFYNRHRGLAETHIDRAIALNPNQYSNYCVKAWMLVYSGEPADGIACAMEGRKINPIASSGCHINIGIGEYTAQRYGAAVRSMMQARKFANMRDFFIAAGYAQLGESDEATRRGQDLVQRYEGLTEPYGGPEKVRWRAYVDSLFPYQRAADMEHFVEALRKAGLPL